MPEFRSLLSDDGHSHHHHKKPGKSKGNSDTHTYKLHVIQSTPDKRGCDYCPLSKKKGIHKVLGKVRGRDIFIWPQSPGFDENREGRELVGKSGKFLWWELDKVGITRDMCDIQNVVRCLDGNTRIYLPDGSTRHLRGLVTEMYEGEVLSYDEENRKYVAAKVTGWYRSRRAGRKLYRVSYDGCKQSSCGVGVVASEDHQFLTRDGWVYTSNLNGKQLNIGPQGVGCRALQVAIGTMLGDSHIPKGNAHIEFNHSHHQEEWLRLKALMLNANVSDRRVRKDNHGEDYFTARTFSSRFYAKLRSKFYKHGRKYVSKWTASKIGVQALATWYMDDGSIKIRGGRLPSCQFATCNFDYTSVKRLVGVLRKFGFSPTIRGTIYPRIFLNVEDTPKFVKLISKFVPPSMRYKLGELPRLKFEDKYWRYEGVFPLYAKAVVSEIESKKDDLLYCIDVEKTHNFITSVGVTHNCVPADKNTESVWPPMKMRAPNKQEIKACSIYNEKALAHSKAKLNLVFGEIAAKELLKKEYRKGKSIFYSERLKGWVVLLYHPSYFVRMGYEAGTERAPNKALQKFRADLKSAIQLYKSGNVDKFAFIKKQNYIGITHSKQARKVYRYLSKQDAFVFDVESGQVDKHGNPDDNGKPTLLCVGFCVKPGTSYVFPLHKMRGLHISAGTLRLNRKLVIKLLTNLKIKKSAHYGISDVDAVKKLLGVRVRGYNIDTLLSAYFYDPDAKAYGLEKIAERMFPDFMGYKDIRWPEAFTKKLRKKFEKSNTTLDQAGELAAQTHQMNLARLPWKKMVLYNGADCHLEKLVEVKCKTHVNKHLMGIYKDASYILFQMERDPKCQPLFDYEWSKKISKIFKHRRKTLAHKLKKAAGKYAYIPKRIDGKIDWEKGERFKVRFNPDSPDHKNWLIYDKWGYTPLDGKGGGRNTRKGTLTKLAAKHPKVRIVPEYNAECKVVSTYINSYVGCADLNDGHLRTNWKQTGTGTGRLSSGATKDRKNLKVINLQNVHGDDLVKCQLISDKRWRKLYNYWLRHSKRWSEKIKGKDGKEIIIWHAKGGFNKHTWKRFRNYVVQLGFDFSQNELREVAEECGDEELCKIFASKELWKCHKSNGGCGKMHKADPHVLVGHELTGWAKEVIAHNDRVRRVIKNMQFGIVFGLQDEGLYQYVIALGATTTRKEVRRFHKKYFRRFRKVKNLQERYRKFAEENDYVINPYGFRRNMNVKEQQEAEEAGEEREGGWWGNKAINTPIQSAAHHFLTMAIAVLKRKPKKYRKLHHPQLEVHDALYFGVPLRYLLKAAKLGYDLMVNEPMRIVKEEFGIDKKVPLATKPKAGFRFGVHIEDIGSEGLETEWEFLNAWCLANYELELSYQEQLKAANA